MPLKQILFIGGEQDGRYNQVADKVQTMKLKGYRQIDFKKMIGIVTLDKPLLRTEIYNRRVIDGVECFKLEEVINEE
jgi:hypothetical protein